MFNPFRKKPKEVTAADSGADTVSRGSPEAKNLEQPVVDAIRTVYDPEIPINVYDLGLIYDIDLGEDGSVGIRMTLTAPACPVAGTLPGEVERAVSQVPGIGSARVELVWDPPWSTERMSEAARLELGML